ncbi:LIM domain-binding protein [Aspergillus stella-maris]|uniref:LIM domain-binding protein n=1 Tax=Aspergillus stella-maris TaxID=1810926 RepID=UPI003CCD270E
MAPGQHPNAHPGAMMQQLHPGVSGPGPQVSQGGQMMQMAPGAGTAGPGGPVQAHIAHMGQPFMPQYQNFGGNQQQQQQIMQQHQHNIMRQRLMFQQAQAQHGQPHQQPPQSQPQQHGGLSVTLPNGTQAMNTHMAAMQNPMMRPNMQMQQLQMSHGQPQNIQQQQQQQQQFLAMQQAAQAQAAQAQVQQAQQAQQAQQQNAAVQPGQHTPQQRPAPQPQNVHEAQSVTPQPQPGPPPHQGSATPQPNPPQAPTSQPSQQQPVVTQQSQPTPNLAPQQLPQGQQPGPQPQQQQQPPQTQQQQSQPQPQPQAGQQQPGQQQGQQSHQMSAQEVQMKAQQQQQQNAAMLLQQQRMAMHGKSILQLGHFAEQISNFQSKNEASDLAYWSNFVEKFYSPSGVLRQGVFNSQAGAKQFEIATPALARYYFTQFTSGIRQIQMVTEGAREREAPNGGHIVECPKANFIYWFTNNSQLFSSGTLKAHFDFQNRIEMLDIVIMSHQEFLPRSQLQALELDQKQSPKVTKATGKRAQQKQPQQPAFTLPESMVTSNGVPTPVMSFLEVAETISQMQLLFQWSHSNPNLTPSESLRSLVANFQNIQNPNPMMMQGPMNPGLQQPPGARAPSMGGPNQFASPGMNHLNLPGGVQGSPHLSAHPSPAQSHLAGTPGMGPQGQLPQQVPSASASPNVTNKRRRASTVKMEGDEAGGEVNGTTQGQAKVKASPRVGGKRQKGTAA